MLTQFILGSLILAVSLSSQSLLGDAAEGRLSVRQQFDSEVTNLQKNLKICRRADDYWIFLRKAESQLKDLRTSSPLQVEPDEMYMDLLISSLKAIPRKAGFKKQDCDAYHTTILAQFDPTPSGKADEPVAKTMAVLDLLCRK